MSDGPPGPPRPVDAGALATQLNAALRLRGDPRRARDAQLEPFAHRGLIADLHLLRVHWQGGGHTLLVAKGPTAHPGSRHVAQLLRMYGRELGFYRALAATSPVATPACLLASGDDDQFALLLEHLDQARTGDQLAGLTLPEAESAVRQLAQLHAHWWQSEALARQPWLPAIDQPWFVAGLQRLYQTAWSVVRPRHAAQLPSHVVRHGDAFAGTMPALMAHLARPPWTLGHGDLRADNLMFDAHEQPIFIDWQLCDRARPGRDLAYLISQGMPTAQRRLSGESLVAGYLEELQRLGVLGYPAATLHEDLRIAAAYLFAYGVIASGAVDHRDPHGTSKVLTMLERSYAMAEDYAGWS